MQNSFHGGFSEQGQEHEHMDEVSIRQKNLKLTEDYYLCMMTFIQTRALTVYAKELLKHFQIFHAIIIYMLLAEQPLSESVRKGLQWILQNQEMYRLIQILVYISDLSAIILIILLYSKALFPSTKTKIVQIIVKNVPFWSEFIFFLAAYLMIISFVQNFIAYLASMFIYFYSNVMLINDTNRSGTAFITSSISNLYFCIIFASFYTANWVCLAVSSPVLHAACLMAGGVAYLIWYQAFGHKLYLNPHLQRSLDIRIALTCVMVIQIMELKWTGSFFLASDNLVGILLTSLIISAVIIKYTDSRFERSYHSFESSINSSQKLKQFELFLWSYQKEQIETIETKSYLKGMMKEISGYQGYIDDEFGVFTTKKSIYRNNDGLEDSSAQPFQQVLMNYIHIKYQTMLKNCKSKDIIVNYVDFMLNTSGNFYRLHLLTQRLRHLNLGVLDELKMVKISLIIKKNIEKFNNQVYEHFDLDQIMECEDVFHDILANINVVIQKNIDIWRQVTSKSINQTIIEDNLKNIHNNIENIDQYWLKLTHFLKTNKKWLFIYLVYSLYIKNQQIKSYLLAEIEEDDTFNEKMQVGKSEIFNLNTFYLRCRMTNEELRILKVSPNATSLIDYSQDQILGHQLNMILPEQIHWNHNQKVMNWLQKGQCNQDKSYRTIYSYLMVKKRTKIPAKIIFTLHIDYASQYNFQFVALLNVKTQKPVDMDESCEGQNPNDALLKIDKRGQIILDNRNNIFLKQKNLRPVENHNEISFVKLMLSIMVLGILFVNLVYAVKTYTQLTDLQGNVISYFNFLNLYRFPMSIGKNFMKIFLNLGNQTKVMNQIDVVYSQIITFSQDPFTIQTIFNPNVNKPFIYYPYMNNSFNQGIGLNQIDIFYQILSNLAALSKIPININRTGYEFTQFNMYLKPAYDSMINGTKYRLNQMLGETIQKTSDNQYVFAGIHASIVLIILLIIAISIYHFLRHMEGVMKIVFQLEQGSIKTITQYWKQFEVFFGFIKVQSENYERTIRKARKTAFIQQKPQRYANSNLNRREKEVKLNKNYRKSLYIFFSILFVLFLGILSVNLMIQFYSIDNFRILKVFYNAGFYFLRFYPVTSTLGHATLQKYYSVIYPKQITFQPKRFKDTIEALFIMGNTSYIGNIEEQNSVYYQKQKHFLFSNPCVFDPTVMMAAQVTMAQCLTYNNKSFTSGIISYIRNIQSPLSDYLNGKINMTYSQLDEMAASLSLVTYYITDIIEVWSYEFVDRVSVLKQNIIIVLSIASAITMALYIIILILVKNTLQSAYKGVVYMLSYMMPQSILLKQKITKQKLVALRILKG